MCLSPSPQDIRLRRSHWLHQVFNTPHSTVMACIVHTSTRGSGDSLPWSHDVLRCILDMQDSLLLGPMVAGMQDRLVEKPPQSLCHLQARAAHWHLMISRRCSEGGASRQSTAFSMHTAVSLNHVHLTVVTCGHLSS